MRQRRTRSITQTRLDEEDRNGYFAEPLVCSDVLGVYEQFLQQYPDSGWDRGSYVKWLSRCGRTSEAKRQLNMIPPDRLRVGAFGGQAAYEKLLKRLTS